MLIVKSNLSKTLAALLLLSFSACGPSGGSGDDDDSGPSGRPNVRANSPFDGASDVPLNTAISATFNEAMDPASLTTSTFTLTSGAPGLLPVPGTVTYRGGRAMFRPAAQLKSNDYYIATITMGAENLSGVALLKKQSWGFTTGSTLVGFGVPVELGTAGNFAVLAKSGISTVPDSAITGDLGVSPAAATYITGFSLIADSSNVFSTSPQVAGQVFAADYAVPSPSNLTAAIGDMEIAFADASGRAPDVIELSAGLIGGATLAPGVYKWGTGVLISSNLTLSGNEDDVWIFQIAQDLAMAPATNVFLAGGAQPKNIFWQVAGAVDIGTTAHCEGVILSKTSVNLRTGASINGRVLAQTAIDLDSSTVVEPAP